MEGKEGTPNRGGGSPCDADGADDDEADDKEFGVVVAVDVVVLVGTENCRKASKGCGIRLSYAGADDGAFDDEDEEEEAEGGADCGF